MLQLLKNYAEPVENDKLIKLILLKVYCVFFVLPAGGLRYPF